MSSMLGSFAFGETDGYKPYLHKGPSICLKKSMKVLGLLVLRDKDASLPALHSTTKPYSESIELSKNRKCEAGGPTSTSKVRPSGFTFTWQGLLSSWTKAAIPTSAKSGLLNPSIHHSAPANTDISQNTAESLPHW